VLNPTLQTPQAVSLSIPFVVRPAVLPLISSCARPV
jgi:hypothetical protein